MERASSFIATAGAIAVSILLAGCIPIPPPDALDGVWKNVNRDDDGSDGMTSRTTTSYRFANGHVTRVIEMVLCDVASGDQVTLTARDTASFTADETATPYKIAVADMEQTAYPSTVDFGGAAALVGIPAEQLQALLDTALESTLQARGIYERNGATLRLRFGPGPEYPPDLNGGVVISVEWGGALDQIWPF